MTWSRILTTGSGKTEFRLVVEGLDTQFVTHPSMALAATTTTGARKLGLLRDGIEISEEADLLRATLKQTGMTFRIADISMAATACFATRPTKTTWITADVEVADTNIEVYSTSGWTTDDVLHMATEAMNITVVVDSTNFTVTRAAYSTDAQKHQTSDGYYRPAAISTDKPFAIQGRRAFLFVYGEGDSLSGNGTLVWRGVVAGEPCLDSQSTIWSLNIDPISTLLKQTIGFDQSIVGALRGIYFPWDAPLIVGIGQKSTGTADAAFEFSDYIDPIVGFFETQALFVQELNDRLETASSGWDVTFGAEENDGASYKITVTTQGNKAPVLWQLSSACGDAIQGDANSLQAGYGWFQEDDSSVTGPAHAYESFRKYSATIGAVVPRFSFGHSYYDPSMWVPLETVNYPYTRLYIDRTLNVSGMSTIVINWNQDATGYHPVSQFEVDVDTATNSVEVDETYYSYATGVSGTGISYTNYRYGSAVNSPTIRPIYLSFSGVDNLANLLDWLADNSTEYCNSGLVPFLTSDDFDFTNSITTINDVINSNGAAFLTDRNYGFVKPVSLESVLAAELQLLGCYLATNGTGKMTVQRLSQAAVTQNATFTISSSNELVDSGFTGYEIAPFGITNTITVYTGYDAWTGEWYGTTYTVRDVSGIAVNRQPRTVEIKPYSGETRFTKPSASDVISVTSPLFSLFGVPYTVATFKVPMTSFNTAILGSVVGLTSAVIPNSTGTRGLTSQKGTVIGRKYDMTRGFGWLQVMISLMPIAGYVPAVRVTNALDTSAGAMTSWDFEADNDDSISGTSWLPSGYTSAEDWFEVGDQIVVYQWDATSPTRVSGAVTAVSANDVSITIASGTNIASGTWIMTFDSATDASLTTLQASYAFIAGSDRLIDFTTAKSARVFG